MQVVISVKLFSQGGRITCAMLYEKTKKRIVIASREQSQKKRIICQQARAIINEGARGKKTRWLYKDREMERK